MANEWISVKDRLPEKNETKCLVYYPDLNIEIMQFFTDEMASNPEVEYEGPGFYSWFDDIEYGELVGGSYGKWEFVTHWMPLPEPPEEDAR